MKPYHIISPEDYAGDMLTELLELGSFIADQPDFFSERYKGKILATMFYEPSTRTRLSFEAAMLRLGGNVIGFSDAGSSSVSKGESVGDTIRTIACYADIAAMRHPLEGAPEAAAQVSPIPVINAGDGGNHHPSQTLTDLLTIKRNFGRINHLTVGLCGDLKYGRTVHSLIEALGEMEGISFVAISPKELSLSNEILKDSALSIEVCNSLENALPKLDVLYMTRIQRERFEDKGEYERLRGSFVLTPELMSLAKSDMAVLHPLPRVDEISPDVDSDPRALYFSQVQNGLYIRMALILTLLDKEGKSRKFQKDSTPCKNKKCITNHESLPQGHDIHGRCSYCGKEKS